MTLQKHLVKDMSPRAVKKNVVATATQRPLTIYPAAVALLGGAFALLIDANIFALGAMAVGGVMTSTSWMWEYFVRGNTHATNFIKRCRDELAKRRIEALGQLKKDLTEAGDDQGLKQIQLFKDKYDNFEEILKRKLGEGELTYQRYLTIAEQVYLGGLDNLENAALAMKSVSAVDVPHIQQELIKLDEHKTDASKTRIGELKARLSLRESQMQRASALLLENEQALTQLDHVATKIAEIKTQQGRAQLDLEHAMAELQHLIIRSEDYSK